ncbi:hypothetical protein HMPREF1554_01689, partial [Porphyromonas gingivalis F0569]|uniref:hypothetical protein n=1 Tax=Porphyromonas gingivalis TaxID=837 RepID=UPI0003ACDACB
QACGEEFCMQNYLLQACSIESREQNFLLQACSKKSLCIKSPLPNCDKGLCHGSLYISIIYKSKNNLYKTIIVPLK